MKRILKTIAALGVSLACLCGGTVNAFATTSYNSCDTNRDGSADAVDSLLLYKCMRGLEYVDDPAVLDADGNHIVSNVDVKVINNYTMIGSAKSTVQGCTKNFGPHTSTAVPNANQTLSQQYIRHSLKTNANTYYTLTTSTSEGLANSSSSTRSVIGSDGRQKDAVDGVVCLFGDNYGVASGFVVGDNLIATAAHCVYDYDNSMWLNDYKIYFADSNGVVDKSNPITPVQVHIPRNYFNSDDGSYDYALIEVEEDLSDHYVFEFGMPYAFRSNSIFKQYDVFVTGYPADLSYAKQMYTGSGHTCGGTSSVIYYNTDTFNGNSGGPVYVKEKTTVNGKEEVFNTVVGIHARSYSSYNGGPFINAIMLKFYNNNSYANY